MFRAAHSMTRWSQYAATAIGILSDWQKDHPARPQHPPSDLERIAHALLGLADMFELLVKRLREFATKLFAADKEAHEQSGEAQS